MESQFLEKVLEEELFTEEEEMTMDSEKKCDYAALIKEELAEMPALFHGRSGGDASQQCPGETCGLYRKGH